MPDAGRQEHQRYSRQDPLYLQVKRRLAADIEAGVYPVGGNLPPEPALCDTLGVSRITLRRAISELAGEGRLKRLQGTGTVVLPPKYRQALMDLSGFTDTMSALETDSALIVLQIDDDLVDADLASLLSLPEEARLATVERLFRVSGRPLTLEQLAFGFDALGDVLTQVAEGQSFFKALQDCHGIRIAGAERLIDVAFPDAEESQKLGITRNDPIFRIRKTICDEARRPIAVSVLRTPCSAMTLSISN